MRVNELFPLTQHSSTLSSPLTGVSNDYHAIFGHANNVRKNVAHFLPQGQSPRNSHRMLNQPCVCDSNPFFPPPRPYPFSNDTFLFVSYFYVLSICARNLTLKRANVHIRHTVDVIRYCVEPPRELNIRTVDEVQLYSPLTKG